MHDLLRERLIRGIEALPEDRLYQVLDYVEFLGSKYARDGARASASPLRRFGERLEDHMRMQGVGMAAIRGTLDIVGTADKVMNNVADAGRSILKDVEKTVAPPSERNSPRLSEHNPPSPPPPRPEKGRSEELP